MSSQFSLDRDEFLSNDNIGRSGSKVRNFKKTDRNLGMGFSLTTDPGIEKDIPKDLQTEEDLLGALLIDADLIVKVASILTPDDFFSDKHANCYAAIMDCYLRGVPPDLITIRDALRAMGALGTGEGQISGSQLMGYYKSYTNPHFIMHYAKIILNFSFIRRGIGRMAATTGAYFDSENNTDPSKIVESLVEDLKKDLAWYNKVDKKSYIRSHEETLDYMTRMENDKEAMLAEQRGGPGGSRAKRARFGFENFDGVDGRQEPTVMMLPTTCTTVLAPTGKGKTTFLENVAEANAMAGLNVFFIATETGLDQLENRRFSRHAGINALRMEMEAIEHNILTSDEWARISKASARISQWPGKIDYYNALGMKASEIVLEIESRHMMMVTTTGHGYDLICLDYIGRVRPEDHFVKGNRREDEGINDNMLRMSETANRLRLPFLIASQVKRADNSEIKVDSAKGSGGIEHYSQVMLSIDSDEENNAVITVLKQNFGPVGFKLKLTSIPSRFKFEYQDDIESKVRERGDNFEEIIGRNAIPTDTVPERDDDYEPVF